MASMPIEVVLVGEVPETIMARAISVANLRQTQFTYILMSPDDSQHFQVHAFRDINGPTFLHNMEVIRNKIRGYHPYIIAFADGHLSGTRLKNLFAHDRPDVGLGVATTANVAEIIFPTKKLHAYFVYRLAKQTLDSRPLL